MDPINLVLLPYRRHCQQLSNGIRDEAVRHFVVAANQESLRTAVVDVERIRWQDSYKKDWLPEMHEEGWRWNQTMPARYEEGRRWSRMPEGRRVLSLLDIAVFSGDAHKATILHSIGVPQRFDFKPCDLCDPFTGVANTRTTQAVMIAYQLCPHLFRKVRTDTALLGRAIAGKQDDLSALLINSVASTLAKRHSGHFFFRIWTLETRKHCQLASKMESLLLAVDLGIDIRSMVIDPCLALSDNMMFYCFVSLLKSLKDPWSDRPLKWRAGQTLLEMAIRCGQLDATRYLTQAHCEATGLTSSDLEGPMFRSTQVGTSTNLLHEATINRNVPVAEAARLAYHLCRHRYQVLIVQMAGWWSHKDGKICVAWRRVVDHIAAFALAVPALPEILQLPRPRGTRRAAKRAAYHRGRAQQIAITQQLAG